MRSRALELHTVQIRELRESKRTTWCGDGVLDIDLAELAALASSSHVIADASVELVRPGDHVRLVNVIDVVEPATKPDDPAASFPGTLGELRPAGTGRTVRLGGAAIVAVADLDESHGREARAYHLDGDSVIDMAGPGARCNPWSSTHNIVLSFKAVPGAPLSEVDRAIRYGMLATADSIARAASTVKTDDVARVDISQPKEGLPNVCMILQVGSEGSLQDTLLYGRPLEGIVPTLLDPGELLDGALLNGAFDWAGVRNPSYFYQRNAVALELLCEHGVRLNFAGIVVALAYLSSATDKARSALQAANLAEHLGANGAVICAFASGNSQTDLMLTIRSCEQVGIATVGLVAETTGGLTDHVAEADSLVSVGNSEELVPGWAPDRVIGGGMRTERDPSAGEPMPLLSYIGSTSQLGNTQFKAVWN